MINELLLPLGLLGLGIFFLGIEVFIPSAGVLGVCAAGSLIAAVAMAFYQCGMGVGTTFMGFTLVIAVGTIAGLVRWWPQTTLGKLILVEPPQADDVVPSKLDQLRALVGEVGQASVIMLPGGIVRMGGKNYDAVSDGGAIEQGTWVEVVSVRGLNLVVRPISEEMARSAQAEGRLDTMSAPTDGIVPDPFDDPLS